ncbi:MAG: hypothetical protein M9887_12635 [Chitinophagales bacterium]|nr:hypothetical protein [Chitinophagales bacterium]
MSYQIINNLPVDFIFSGKSKSELRQYEEWFEINKNQRLNQLVESVKASKGFENWDADFTPISLKELGAWMTQNIKTEKISEEIYKQKRLNVPDYINMNDWDMTNETYSKLIDVGIYFGEVFIKNHSNLKWEQFFSKIKNDSDHGHMVIKGFGKDRLNPLRIVYIIGSKMADNKSDEGDIYKSYKTWKSYLS